MKQFLLLVACFISFGCSSTQSKSPQPPVTPPVDQPVIPYEGDNEYVVILSMDAFRWDLPDHANTPTLDSLKKVGTFSEMIPVVPSNTFPSHYAMATGLYPNHHGVVNNSFYDKERGRVMSVFSDDIKLDGFWGGEPIWNTVELQDKIANIFMWTGSDQVINNRRPSVYTEYDGSVDYYKRADWVVGAMNKPESTRPNLVMWYMDEPDHTMHSHGPISEESIEQAERIDRVLKYFFYNIRKSPVFDKINFIITADHGMCETSGERYLNLYNKIDRSKIVRVVYGNPMGMEIEPDYLDEAVRLLNQNKEIKAYRSDRTPERMHYGSHPTRISNLLIFPNSGWTLDYNKTDRPKSSIGGSHGYDPEFRDMHMVFYGSGPAFKAGYIQPSFVNHNIYQILCHLTSTTPSKNDGNWDDVKGMFVK